MKQIKSIIIAAVFGAMIMFVWGGFSHSVLLIGVGFDPLPNEDKVIQTLNTSIDKQGLYFFPGKNFKNSTVEEENAWQQKFRTGPAGILVYRPLGGNAFSPNKLLTQFASNFLVALILSFIASLIVASYWQKVFALTLLGLSACFSVGTIYWNWYEFPTSFFIAQCVDMAIGFCLAGLLIAKLARKYGHVDVGVR
jgi:hypothetical protein